MGGNTNGISIQATATGNTIRRNIIAGNPPSQISRDYGTSIGADIRDESTAPGSGDRNTFQENWCVTYSVPGPGPCPSLSNQPIVAPVACATPAPAADWLCVDGGWSLLGIPLPVAARYLRSRRFREDVRGPILSQVFLDRLASASTAGGFRASPVAGPIEGRRAQ